MTVLHGDTIYFRDADIPDPIHHGWVIEGKELSIEWMKGPDAAPDVILEFLSCKCMKECKAASCPLINNAIKLQVYVNIVDDCVHVNDSSDEDDEAEDDD